MAGHTILVSRSPVGDSAPAAAASTEPQRRLQDLDLKTIIENQPGLVWLKDAGGRFLAVNTAFAASCGRGSPEALVGLTDLDVWPKALADKYRADDAEVMASGAPKTVEELIADQGQERWFETFKSPVRNESATVVGTTGYARDITERKQVEEQLRQRERELRDSLNQVKLFRTLVECSGDCFYMVDVNDAGRMCYVNAAAERHFGAPRDVICTWHIPDWDPDFTVETVPQLAATIEQERTLHLNRRHRVASGAIVPVEITVNFMKSSDGRRLAYGWFSDISARLAAEAELRNAKLQAEAASRAKSEFLANMSHEVRTPLNGVIGFTELLRKTPLSPTQQQYVDNIHVSAHSLLGVVDDILDFSKIEAGMMALEAVQTDLVELLQSSVEVVRFLAIQKNLAISLKIDPSMPRVALVDPVRLRQILANLLGNAVKFTEQGEVELRVTHERLEGAKTRFRIAIRDTGIGISEAQKEKLFKAFVQADSSTTRRFGGIGLGLVISDLIARKMGSKIQVDSTPGQGSIFFFDLAAETEDRPPGEMAASGESAPATGAEVEALAPSESSCCKILIVEDVALNMILVESIIQMTHPTARLCQAGNGAAAVEQYEKEEPDIILMDLQMPTMDGLEASRAIRALEAKTGRHAHIVALTAGAFREEQERCLAAGMDDFLTKPVVPEKLKRVLDGVIAKQRPLLFEMLSKGTKRRVPVVPTGPTGSPELAFDWDLALRRWNNNETRLRGVLKRFAESYAQGAENVRAALVAGDHTRACGLLHELKGVAGNLGALSVQQTAEALESEVKSGQGSPTSALMATLSRALDMMMQGISRLAPQPPTRSTSEVALPSEQMVRGLRELDELLAQNRLSARQRFASLKGALVAMQPTQAEQLEQDITRLAYKSAREVVASLIVQLKQPM